MQSDYSVRWVGLALAAVVGLLGATGCATGDASTADAGATPAAEKEAADDEALPMAADFTLENVAGGSYTLSERGQKVTLVDFWATWCAPCREEVPMLNRLHTTYADQGFEVVAISDFEESADLVRDFVKEYEVEYTNLLGAEEMGDKYVVMGLPMAYLIDAEGRVVESYFGPKPPKALEEKIQDLLAAKL